MKDTDYTIKGSDVTKGFNETLLHARGVIFQQLELTLTGLCNRSCGFCPRTDPKIFESKKEYLSLEKISEISQELSLYSYSGRFSLSGFGEPFTHPELDRIVESLRRGCPSAKIDIITNGDFMKTSIGERLLRGSLFDRILISAYDGPDQFDRLSAEFAELVDSGKILIRKRYLTEDNDEFDMFSSRTGLVDYGNSATRNNICYYPYYNILIDSNGDVVACSHDWGKQKIFGNIYTDSVLNIWFSDEMKSFRAQMAETPRISLPCSSCNVIGDLYGSESFASWENEEF